MTSAQLQTLNDADGSRPALDQKPGLLSSRYARPTLVGLAGAALIALAASLSGSPFAYKVPGAWFFGVPGNDPSGAVAQSTGMLLFVELSCGFAGLLLLVRSWLSITKDALRTPGARPSQLARILGIWSLPLLVAPPLFSDDIYSYAAQGEMASFHISPYLYGPGVLGATPFESLAQGYWINTPSPYGPLFTSLDGSIVRATDYRVLMSLVLLRLLAVFGVVLAAIFLPSLARSYGRDPGAAFALGILNPIVLLFLIGSGHNDALMIGLLVAGLAMARRGNIYFGIALCALAGAVKAPGLIGVVGIAWSCARAESSPRRRAFVVVTSGLVAMATLECLTVLAGFGWGWLHTLGATAQVTNWITPSDLVTIVLSHLVVIAHVNLSFASLLGPVHLFGFAVAAGVGLWAFLRMARFGLLGAMGIALLAVVLLGPSVQPWYLIWGIMLLSVVSGRRVTSAIIALSVTVSFLGLAGIHLLADDLGSLGAVLILLFLVVLATSAIVRVDIPVSSPLQAETLARVTSALGLRNRWNVANLFSSENRNGPKVDFPM
jgi:alpha-1,6-mannosyltransferase